MISGTIYKIVNVTDGHLYVGSALIFEQRWTNHRTRLRANNHHSIRLQRAWNRDGEQSFEFSVMETVSAKNKISLQKKIVEREQYWIAALGGYGLIGYNMSPTASSVLGTIRSPEYRAKQSASRLGIKMKPASNERKRKIGDAHRGRIRGPMSDAHKAAISRGNKGRKLSNEQRDRLSKALTGLKYGPMSETRKQILRDALTGRTKITEAGREKLRQLAKEKWARRDGSIGFFGKRTPEICEKISAGQRGKRHSDESYQKMSLTKRRQFREKRRREFQAEFFG